MNQKRCLVKPTVRHLWRRENGPRDLYLSADLLRIRHLCGRGIGTSQKMGWSICKSFLSRIFGWVSGNFRPGNRWTSTQTGKFCQTNSRICRSLVQRSLIIDVPTSLWSSVQEFIEQTEKKTSKIKISGGAISIGSSLLAITGMILSLTLVSDSKNFDIKPCRKSLQQASYLFHSG